MWSLEELSVSPSASREVIVSGELWLVRPSPPLVPIPLGSPSDGGRQRSGVATRGGAGCISHDKTGEYAVRWGR